MNAVELVVMNGQRQNKGAHVPPYQLMANKHDPAAIVSRAVAASHPLPLCQADQSGRP